jgi:hypothetical protein
VIGHPFYQRLDCPSDRGYDCLRLVRSAGGGFRRLARFRGGSLSPVSWSSDGTRIAVPVWPPSPPDPAAERPWKIAVVTTRNGKIRLVTPGAAPAVPSAPIQWGAKAGTLAFVLQNLAAPGGP